MKALFPVLFAALFALGIGTAAAEVIPPDAAPGIYYTPETHTAVWLKRNANGKWEAWVCPRQGLTPTARPDTLGWHYCPTVKETTTREGRQNARSFTFTHAASGVRFRLECHWQNFEPINWLLRTAPRGQGQWGSAQTAIKILPSPEAPIAFVAQHYARLVETHGHGHLPALPEDTADPDVAEKPVLYLYPTQPTPVAVSLAVPQPSSLVAYPPLAGNAWRVLAQPDGMLTDAATGTQYPSLFWEAPLALHPPMQALPGGWVVARDTLLPFLEARLAEMNFSPRERAEFIQYWLPRMLAHPQVFVHFAFAGHHAASGPYASPLGEAYATQAPLTISPAPANLLRVMMLWHPIGHTGHAPAAPQALPRPRQPAAGNDAVAPHRPHRPRPRRPPGPAPPAAHGLPRAGMGWPRAAQPQRLARALRLSRRGLARFA